MVGQVFAMFVLTVAAAEAAIGLAILVVFYRNRGIDRRGRRQYDEGLIGGSVMYSLLSVCSSADRLSDRWPLRPVHRTRGRHAEYITRRHSAGHLWSAILAVLDRVFDLRCF